MMQEEEEEPDASAEVIIGRSSALFCHLRPVLLRWWWWWKGADLFSRERVAGRGGMHAVLLLESGRGRGAMAAWDGDR
ncbi:unnamed protein product [Calypogeia fissa]